MKFATNSFKVLGEKPERLWALLSDFAIWEKILFFEKPTIIGLGNRMLPDKDDKGVEIPPAAGLRIGMFHGDKLMQVFQVQTWTPPSALKIKTVEYHGPKIMAHECTVEFEIKPGAPQSEEYVIHTSLTVEFVHPFFKYILQCMPVKGYLTDVLDRIERRFVKLLTETPS